MVGFLGPVTWVGVLARILAIWLVRKVRNVTGLFHRIDKGKLKGWLRRDIV